MADLILASLHHLLVFALFAVFAVEMALVRPGLDGAGVRRLARIDGIYGGIALAVLVVGFARAFHGLRGWEYYSHYWVFWAKVGVFLVVGLLSIVPTLRIRRWAGGTETAATVADAEIAAVRPWLMGQGVFLLAIPVLAAMLSRGVGY